MAIVIETCFIKQYDLLCFKLITRVKHIKRSFVCCIYTTKHSFINIVVVMSYFDLVCCLKGVEKKFSERVK